MKSNLIYFLAVGLALILVLAACGGEDSPTTADPLTPTSDVIQPGAVPATATTAPASSPSPKPTPTETPPTETPVPPTATPEPPTSTPTPPTPTPTIAPSATPTATQTAAVSPTGAAVAEPTATAVPPTATPSPTATPVAPTVTPPPPTATLVPSTANPTPEPITLDILTLAHQDKLIAVGTTITWINTGRLIHTTTSGVPPSNLSGLWDSNNLRRTRNSRLRSRRLASSTISAEDTPPFQKWPLRSLWRRRAARCC